MSEQHNIRTISQLPLHKITAFNDIYQDNISFEITKKVGNDIQTYRIDAKQFIDALSSKIFEIANKKYVSISGDPQEITSHKIFNCKLSCLDTVKIQSDDVNNPLLSCNSPINGVAMSAWWA